MSTKRLPIMAMFGSMEDKVKTAVEDHYVDSPIESTLIDKLNTPFEESGSVVTCNPVEGYPLGVVSQIEPVQEGSGDPYPPGGGKNLLNLSGRTVAEDSNNPNTSKRSLTGNQIFVGLSASNYLNPSTITSYTVNETSVALLNSANAYGIGFDLKITPGTTYTFSCAEQNYIGCSLFQEDGTLITYGVSIQKFTVTAPEDAVWLIAVLCPQGDHVNTELTYTNLQVEVGETVTDYAPYANIRPISGWTGAKLQRCGKNLIDDSNITYGYELLSTRGVEIVNSDWYLTGYIPVKPFTTYAQSGLSSNTVCYYNADKVFIGYVKLIGFTTPANCYFVRLNSLIDGYATPQLELGSTATEYEPYRGEEFTLDFGQTVYGGQLDWNTGVLTVNKCVLPLTNFSSVNTPTNTAVCSAYWTNVAAGNTRKDGTPVLCDSMQTVPWDGIMNYTSPVIWYAMASFGVCVSKDMVGVTDADDNSSIRQKILAYISDLGVTIVYEISEPITIQLTPQEVLALSGTNVLYSDTGNITVSGKADPASIIEKLTNAIIALGGNV